MTDRMLLVLLVLSLPAVPVAADLSTSGARPEVHQAQQAERERMYRRYQRFWDHVEGASKLRWLADGSSFCFVEGGADHRVFHRVDPVANTVIPVFDTAKVREALERKLGHAPAGEGLPFADFQFLDDEERHVEFKVQDQRFRLNLDSYEISSAVLESTEPSNTVPSWRGESPSPDGLWVVSRKERNLWLRSTADGLETQITEDGEEYLRWYPWSWSPDSSHVVLYKADLRTWRRSPYVNWLGDEYEIEWQLIPDAGTPWDPELHVFAVEGRRLMQVDIADGPSQQLWDLGWTEDGSEFLFGRVDRWYKKLELLAFGLPTGEVRRIVTETSDAFLAQTFPRIPNWQNLFTPLDDGERFIWASERDGWRHLYLYRLDGTIEGRLTKGPWPVLRRTPVEVVDEWVYFRGHADPERPYDAHFLRVRLDGSGLSRLTAATGNHTARLSPSKRFFVDTYSSSGRLPIVELRRSDGSLVRVLNRARLRKEAKLQWTPPEEIVVKAADGETNLYGVLFKPWDFDRAHRYPVIEFIYNGPQLGYVAHAIGPPGLAWGEPGGGAAEDWQQLEASQAQALAQLGFVVVMIDGRGTPGRGRAFQDVAYRNFGNFEIADHAAGIRQLAAERPYMDLSRVGIYGVSWGGYFATRALLFAPDLYKVGVAAVPAHPSHWIHEPYLGPLDENRALHEYARNETHIDRLIGHLLFITGTSDMGYPHLMRVLEAFVRSGKPFDLVLLPQRGHDVGDVPGDPATDYYWDAQRRYFQEHLKP